MSEAQNLKKKKNIIPGDLPSPASLTNTRKQGYLVKLGGKGLNRNWKKRWFILDDHSLYYFTDEMASKPKGVISLKSYRECEEAPGEKKLTFRMFNSQKTGLRVFYMKADSREEMQQWIDAIQKALQRVHNSLLRYGPGTLRTEHNLYMKVSEARKLKKERDYYCTVAVDGVQKARTMTIWETKQPGFMQEFDLDIEQDAKELIVILKEDDRKKKENIVGKVSIPMPDLTDGRPRDGWYALVPAEEDSVKGEISLDIVYTPPVPNKNIIGSLKINDVQARDLASEAETYVSVVFKSKTVRSQPTRGTSPGYLGAECQFDVPEYNNTICIRVCDASTIMQSSDEIILGEVEILLKELDDPNKVKNKWWKLSPSREKSIGEVRLTLQFSSSTILPDTSYDNLLSLLLEEDMKLTKLFSTISTKKERRVADCLVKSFETRKTAVHFLKSIISDEIQRTLDSRIIFRGNTVGTKSLDIYMRLTGMPYLQRVLKPIIAEIYANIGKKSCEMDPQRVDQKDPEKILKKNKQTLQTYCQQIFDAIRTSLNICPMSFRNIFEHIQNELKKKFPNDETAPYTGPSGFIFLRFFCPALLNLKAFGLVNDHPPALISREMTLITKTLQNLGNLCSFGAKEPFMHEMNQFIQENVKDMKGFIDDLCTHPTIPPDQIPANTSINFGREMARVHYFIGHSLPRLKSYFPDEHLVAKLDDVLGKLNQELIDNDHDIPHYDSESDSDSFELSNAIVQKRIGSTVISPTTKLDDGMPQSQDSSLYSSSSSTNTNVPVQTDRSRSKSLTTSAPDGLENATSEKQLIALSLDESPRSDIN
jgi:hypothetical protein